MNLVLPALRRLLAPLLAAARDLAPVVDREGNVIGIVSYTDMVLKGLMRQA